MQQHKCYQQLLILFYLTHPLAAMAETEVDWQLTAQTRHFFHAPLDPQQPDNQWSLAIEPEFYHSWNDGGDSLTFKPFYRFDNEDEERQHFDIREMIWIHARDNWEVHLGVGKEYWGVTESQHLVDIINQTDAVEHIDGEQKLGQPMAKFSMTEDWGVIDMFVLPGFRERTFASLDGRLRPPFPVVDDHSRFESSAKKDHVDWALRWSHSIGDWDLGLAFFDGTSREPLMIFDYGGSGQGVLVPYYQQIQQASLDFQATLDNTLWKLESIYRHSDDDNYIALTAGFEHTLVGIRDSVVDLGLLAEYQFDDRDEQATGPGQNDLFIGARLAFNDSDSSELLIGYVQDLDDSGSSSGFLEGSTRINDHLTITVDAWLFRTDSEDDVLFSLRHDDFVQINFELYF